MNAMEIRKLAQSLGIKNAAKYKKAELEEMVAKAQEQAEIERLAAEATDKVERHFKILGHKGALAKCSDPICAEFGKKAAKETKTTAQTARKARKARQPKLCVSCGKRRPTSESREGHLCKPCLTQAEWENTHSDFGHDATSETVTNDATEVNARVRGCWVCYPELDATREDYVAKQGTSRIGMKLHVTPRATGQQKAAQVAEQLKDFGNASIKVSRGVITLTLETDGASVKLAWDANGRYLYDNTEITVAGKSRKARNVSAALKAIQG